jgi:hypothetical protein
MYQRSVFLFFGLSIAMNISIIISLHCSHDPSIHPSIHPSGNHSHALALLSYLSADSARAAAAAGRCYV